MLGFWLEEKHWGNGISTEALGILLKIAKSYQIKKVLAETFKDNLASQKVLEKNGFVKSGEVKRKDKTIYKYQKIII
jgi:RimJ/RimL family protein N-acetyltransferase